MTPTIPAGLVGIAAGPLTAQIDARWLMAYAAGLGETDARYYDTEATEGPVAHPLFPVCYEWPAAVALRDAILPPEVQPRGVHASHRLVLHRRPRAGDVLTTSARVLEVARRRSGTLIVTRFETVDGAGRPVTTTDYGSVYRAVELAGTTDGPVGAAAGPTAARDLPPDPAAPSRWEMVVDVGGPAAHVYSECARIWNPIHTDVAVARQAGLSHPILHGTATLGLAVSRVIARDLGGDPRRVREIRGRFTGMLPLPSTLTVRGRPGRGPGIAFDAVGPGRAAVLGQGVLIPCDS